MATVRDVLIAQDPVASLRLFRSPTRIPHLSNILHPRFCLKRLAEEMSVPRPSSSCPLLQGHSSKSTLRRIPRGVRQKAALALETSLRKVIANPDDLGTWKNLFQFAGSLAQPVRGGKRFNLTTQISFQLDRAATGAPAIPSHPSSTSSTGSLPTVRRKDDKMFSAEELVVRRASRKIQEGTSREQCVSSTRMNLSLRHQTIHFERSKKNILLLHQIAAHLLSP